VLRVVREQAEIVGHRLEWREQLPPDAGETDRREAESMAAARKRQTQPSLVNLFLRLRRTLGKA
jgi:hypothetical protein